MTTMCVVVYYKKRKRNIYSIALHDNDINWMCPFSVWAIYKINCLPWITSFFREWDSSVIMLIHDALQTENQWWATSIPHIIIHGYLISYTQYVMKPEPNTDKHRSLIVIDVIISSRGNKLLKFKICRSKWITIDIKTPTVVGHVMIE